MALLLFYAPRGSGDGHVFHQWGAISLLSRLATMGGLFKNGNPSGMVGGGSFGIDARVQVMVR